jgi:hypothetical protein
MKAVRRIVESDLGLAKKQLDEQKDAVTALVDQVRTAADVVVSSSPLRIAVLHVQCKIWSLTTVAVCCTHLLIVLLSHSCALASTGTTSVHQYCPTASELKPPPHHTPNTTIVPFQMACR